MNKIQFFKSTAFSCALLTSITLISFQPTFAAVECNSTSVTSGAYTFIVFKAVSEIPGNSESTLPCTWNIPSGLKLVDYLLVGGGGGGANPHSGGGGGGGFKSDTAIDVSTIEIVYISIGLGGEGAKNSTGDSPGLSGGDSIVSTIYEVGDPTAISATGGGGGGSNVGKDGGSGGGVFGNNTVGRGVAGQGNNGGKGTTGFLTASSTKYYVYVGGGGGGAGTIGGSSPTYNATKGNFPAGKGGDGKLWRTELTVGIANSLGISNMLFDSGNVYFSGGGGGGNASQSYYFPPTSSTPAAGGKGGGGSGGLGKTTTPATSGVASSGGGGGGGYIRNTVKNSGDGGSGIAIVRYLTPSSLAFESSSSAQLLGNLTYRQNTNLSLVASVAGKVTFKIKGKVIPGCKNKKVNSANSFSATCSYKPASRGYVSMVATLVPTEVNDAGTVSIVEKYFVQGRTVPRLSINFFNST